MSLSIMIVTGIMDASLQKHLEIEYKEYWKEWRHKRWEAKGENEAINEKLNFLLMFAFSIFATDPNNSGLMLRKHYSEQ